MFILDNKGKRIEVTDPDSAIKQAGYFVRLMQEDELFRQIDGELKAYWTDILQKLEALKTNQ